MNRKLVLALALLNAVLYCCSLPLWEGFDEPFHYSYVESISVDHRLPVLNRTRISEEIRSSFNSVPLSRLLSQAMPGSLSFEEWSKLSEKQKIARRSGLFTLTPAMRSEPSGVVNYESQQAPLAYLLYAPFDLLLSPLPLATRVLLLRLLGTVAATLFIFAALEQLADALALADGFRLACLAVIFEGQMLWASIAHVGNDVLAVPLAIWFLARLLIAVRDSTFRNILLLACAFAAGLLTKAYFLAFAPLVAVLFMWFLRVRRASYKTIASASILILSLDSPWYLRNLLLYGSFSGTQQSVAGIGLRQALSAFPQIDWLKSAYNFAMWSLWTGNWSFLSFSRITIWLELLLILVSLFAYVFSRRKITKPEVWLLAACASFGCGLVYQTCVTWVHTAGESTFAEPWYGQGIIAVLLVLGFYGLSQIGKIGHLIAALIVLVAAWVASMTYLAKLLPYYGAGVTRSNIPTLWRWWRNHPIPDLSTVVMISPYALFPVLCAFLLILMILTGRLLSLLNTNSATEQF